MISQKEKISQIANSPLFAGVDPETLRTIAEGLTAERWPRHNTIMAPHQTAERFHIISHGRAKISLQKSSGREVTLFLLGPGDAFNLVSLLDGEEQEIYVQTLDETGTLSAPIDAWKIWLETYPAFRTACRLYFDRQLRNLTQLAGDLALHDTMTRLVNLILRHYDHENRRTHNGINLIKDLSNEELANMIGTVRVVVNRLLAELKHEGLVTTRDGALQVLNMEKLLLKAEQNL